MPRKAPPDKPHEIAHLTDYQRALTSFSRVAAEVLPIDRLLHHAAALVSGVTHIGHVKIMRYRPEEGDLLLEAGVGWKPGYVGSETFALDARSPPGRSMQTGAPVVIEDINADTHYRVAPILIDHGIKSVLNVPIRMDGRMWGVLEIDTVELQHFNSQDIGFLTTVGNILGVALLRQAAKEEAAKTTAELLRQKDFYETILSEFRHRVKNNLQAIVSFLSMQQRQTANNAERLRLEGLMDRVQAISLAQDQLTFKEGASNVGFADYLRALCANIDPQREGVVVEVEVNREIFLPLDRAVSVGLIVNELVTNALKYAFDDTGGIIKVIFTADPSTHEARLTVEDNGRGMGEPREGGMGLRLIEALTGQLEGRVEREPADKGTRFAVSFTLPM